jgi:hypothetical protein
MILKKLFCLHHWVEPDIQKTRINGLFGIAIQYEWRCEKCGKIKWSDYENIPPEPNNVI